MTQCTVVLTTYNRAELLRRALDSVLDQTTEEFKIIVVDDGSTDNTADLLASYNDERVLYERHENNRGLGAARNTGIQLSEAPYVAFLDDDDVWKPEKLVKQISLLERSRPEVALVYCWVEMYANGDFERKYAPTHTGNLFEKALVSQPITNGSTWLIRQSVLTEIGGFDESLSRGIDGDFLRRYFKAGYEVDFVNHPLVEYHYKHGHGRITNSSEEGLRNAIEAESVKLEKFSKDLSTRRPQKAKILARIGRHYARLGEYQNSVKYFIRAARVAPLCADVYKFGARALLGR